jgi:hypothetical protein
MMYSLLLIALGGIAPSVPQEPIWIQDYSQARKLSQTQEKPIAVFIGSGQSGWSNISRDGRLDQDTAKLLAQYYVCLYLDTATFEGQRLAGALEMPQSRGMVISNSKGSLQAFRHEGDLGNEDLRNYLQRFSDPNLVVRHTESNPPVRSYSAPAVEYSSVTITRSC